MNITSITRFKPTVGNQRGLAKSNNDDNITFGGLASGLVSLVTDAFVSSAGALGVTARHTPKMLYNFYRGLVNTKEIGPKLKIMAGFLALPLAVALPFLGAIGGALYGATVGTFDGAKSGVINSVANRIEDIRSYNKFAGTGVKQLGKIADEEKNKEPEHEPYDVSFIKSGTGLLAGAAGSVVDGVGVAGVTLKNWPKGVAKFYSKVYHDEDMNVPTKILLGTVGAVAAALAPFGAVLGGAMYGLGRGAYDGYKEGIVGSVKNRVNDLSKYNYAMKKLINS